MAPEKTPRARGRLENLAEKLTGIKILVLTASAIVLAGIILLPQLMVRSLPPTHETVTLDSIEDNRIANLPIQRNFFLPVYYNPPDYKACIYTSPGEPPLITDVETEPGVLMEKLEFRPLTVSFNQEQLERNGLNRRFNVTVSDSCPIRSEPAIVLKRKK